MIQHVRQVEPRRDLIVAVKSVCSMENVVALWCFCQPRRSFFVFFRFKQRFCHFSGCKRSSEHERLIRLQPTAMFSIACGMLMEMQERSHVKLCVVEETLGLPSALCNTCARIDGRLCHGQQDGRKNCYEHNEQCLKRHWQERKVVVWLAGGELRKLRT